MTIPVEDILAGISEERRAAIEARAADLIAEHQTLSALRKARGYTQAQVAAAMETSQANVAQIERKADVKVSTLAKVVRAMGGRLSLVAEFDDGRHVPLAIGQDGEISAGATHQLPAPVRSFTPVRSAAAKRSSGPVHSRSEYFSLTNTNASPLCASPVLNLTYTRLTERVKCWMAEHSGISPSSGPIIEAESGKGGDIIVVGRKSKRQNVGQGAHLSYLNSDIAHRSDRLDMESVA